MPACWHASTNAKKTAKNEERRGEEWSGVGWRVGLKRRPAASAFLLDSFKPFAGGFARGPAFQLPC